MTTQSASTNRRQGRRPGVSADIRWGAFAVAAVWIGALIPLARNVGYYFVDDSQVDMYGKLWEIGHRIVQGDWALVNPHAWQAGNYVAEQYWGIHSPFLWVFGLVAFLLPNALVAMTGLKMVLFAVAAVGIYLLARSFSAAPPLASLAAVSAPLAGFTLYMDAASWMNGFTAWALVPITWWAVRTFSLTARWQVGMTALLLTYTVVSINYVHATIVLGLVLLASGIDAIRARDRSRVLSAIALGVFWLCCAVAIHLPGLLTAPASGRASSIGNDGFLVANLSGYATAPIGTGAAHTGFFGDTPQNFANAPLMYIAWFIPLAVMISGATAARVLRGPLAPLVAVTVALILTTMAPSELGPLRFPMRLLPYAVVGVMVIFAVLMSRARARFSSRRLATALGLLVFSAGLTWAQSPWYWQWILLVALAGAGGLIATWLILQRHGAGDSRVWARLVPLMLVVSGVVISIQHLPAPAAPLANYRVPTNVSALEAPLPDAVGDVIVVGNAAQGGKTDADVYKQVLVGNLWYLNRASVQNLYTAVYNPAYNQVTCMNNFGATCGELYDRLFNPMPETGEPLVNLLAVSTVVVLKDAVQPSQLRDIPEGWRVADDNPVTRVLVRAAPVPAAGDVVWTSPGTEVTTLRSSAMKTQFRVDKVPPGGGEVAISRIPWPGYVVSGAELSNNLVEGFLMRVELPPDSEGTEVAVQYRMPGEPAVWGALLSLVPLAVILLLFSARGWTLSRNGSKPPLSPRDLNVE